MTTEENPVTDEMLGAFAEAAKNTRLEGSWTSGYRLPDETLRQAIHAAIKAGGFVSEDFMRDSVDAALRGM